MMDDEIRPATADDFRDAMRQANDIVRDQRQQIAELKAENDRLRNLIRDIGDMDVGDIELEHREIISLCRAEIRRWGSDLRAASGGRDDRDG